MTGKQKRKYLLLCKEFNVKPSLLKYYEICHKILVKEIFFKAKAEKLHDGYYWLIDAWILEYNRIGGTDQDASPNDLKVGLAESGQDPIDFLYARLLEIKKYRKNGWKTNKSYDY